MAADVFRLDEQCRRLDQSAFDSIKKSKDDTDAVEQIIIDIAVFAENCSFDKTYQLCSEIGVDVCVEVMKQRREYGVGQ